jgi:hypothetical protein
MIKVKKPYFADAARLGLKREPATIPLCDPDEPHARKRSPVRAPKQLGIKCSRFIQ